MHKIAQMDVTQRTSPGGRHPADVTRGTSPGGCHPADVTRRTSPGERHPADVTRRTSPGGRHPVDVTPPMWACAVTFVAQREAPHLWERLERLEADAAGDDLQTDDGDLVLLDEARPRPALLALLAHQTDQVLQHAHTRRDDDGRHRKAQTVTTRQTQAAHNFLLP